jgi:hypothetical protein
MREIGQGTGFVTLAGRPMGGQSLPKNAMNL